MADAMTPLGAPETQPDEALGVMLACATGLVVICGSLVVYSRRLAYLWDPSSLVVALGLSTGGVLSFVLVDLLPGAQSAFDNVMAGLLSEENAPDDDHPHPYVEGLAALVHASAFSAGVIMAWVLETLCLRLALPAKTTRSSRDQTVLTINQRSPNSQSGRSPSARVPTLVLPSQAEEQATKELLYKTGAAKVVSFALQNVPEGMVLCIVADQQRATGILFACTIALLNVTQGMTLAGLLTQASGFRWRAVLWCILAALALPLGGFLSWAVLLQTQLNSLTIGVFYATVGGMLVGMCLSQTLSVCYSHKASSEPTSVTASVLGGVVLIACLRILLTFVSI